jgi:DNA polymerase-3 subunit epsilon
LSHHRTVVLDFETTGLSANNGDRTIEVGAVALEGGKIVDSFQSLMNPGCRINAFIENYTGINNAMLATAPPCEEVIGQLHEFVGDSVLVAHNASFDRGFLDKELSRIQRQREQPVLCSMRIARRLYPKSPNHKLGTLVTFTGVPVTGAFHRALADAEMTALIWIKMMDLLESRYGIQTIDTGLLQSIESLRIASADSWLRSQSSS